jgi:hypothetical protein
MRVWTTSLITAANHGQLYRSGKQRYTCVMPKSTKAMRGFIVRANSDSKVVFERRKTEATLSIYFEQRNLSLSCPLIEYGCCPHTEKSLWPLDPTTPAKGEQRRAITSKEEQTGKAKYQELDSLQRYPTPGYSGKFLDLTV